MSKFTQYRNIALNVIGVIDNINKIIVNCL